MTKNSQDDGSYTEAEAARRRDAIVRNMIATPPQPHKLKKAKKAKPSRARTGKKSG
jgi:hypothetical protein